MAHYDKVKNVTVYNDLTTTPTTWYQNSNLTFSPDECIVRQISYSGPAAGDGTYLLWSNLTNDFIGSFSLSDESATIVCNVNPNTVLKLNPNSTPSQLQFTIYSINGSSKPVTSSALAGTIVINLDFLSIKK